MNFTNVNFLIKNSLLKYPLVYLFLLPLTFLLILDEVEGFVLTVNYLDNLFGGYKNHYSFILFLFFSSFGFIALKFLKDILNLSLIKYSIYAIFLIILTLSINFYQTHEAPRLFFNLIIIFSTFFIVVLNEKTNQNSLEKLHQITKPLVYALIIGVVLSIGYLIIEALIEELFINVHYKIDDVFLTIIYALIVPTIFLANYNNCEKTQLFQHKALDIIINFVLLPILFIYTAILYLYFAKIFIVFSLPKNELASYLMGFFVMVFIMHIIKPHIIDNNKTLIKFFFARFKYLLILPLLFLYISIGVRVFEYGLTVDRLAVLIITIYATYITFAIFKDGFNLKKSIIYILVSFYVLMFSPFISNYSQELRVLNFLEKHQLLVDNKIFPATKELSLQERIAISSMLNYHTYENTTFLQEYFGSKYNSDILQKLNIKYADIYQVKQEKKYLSNYISLAKYNIDIADYTHHISTIYLNSKSKYYKHSRYIFKNNILTIKLPNNRTYTFDIKHHLTTLMKDKKVEKIRNENIQDAILISDDNKLKVILTDIRGYWYYQKQTVDLSSVKFSLFFNLK